MFKTSKEVGLGVEIRDSQGLVHASLLKKAPFPPMSNDIDAMAVVQAILFAHDLGLSSLILEGCPVVVINDLNSEDESLASFRHLLVAV